MKKSIVGLLFGTLMVLAPSAFAQAPAPIPINGADTGRTFDGIGALSAGASSRLLIDYPPKQRAEILDYLFKPNFGASLQINKVEIGGDMNSTDGAEPSHERTPTDHDYRRGYEWWLMRESKKRNPAIKLYGLEWGAPGWINTSSDDVWTHLNVAYLLQWLAHAKHDYGLTINYLGGWNERGYNKQWYEELRSSLTSGGFADIKIVADDSFGWGVGKGADTDSTFAGAFDIIGQHYPDYSPKLMGDPGWLASLHTGKTLWGSEMGSQPYDTGAGNLAKNYNQGYIAGRMTAFINWSTIWAVYPGLPYPGCGLMLADQPWSGHYTVGQSIWVTAQTTQFAQPGWQYLDGACGYLGGDAGNGSYVALKSPNGRDYSVIIETVDAKSSRDASFAVSGGLSTGPLHVWRTNLKSSDTADWFARQADVQPVNGMFTLTLQPGRVYSLTTTTGQAKGQTVIPPSRVLALPYREDFRKYALGTTPRLFSDQQGAFEVARAGGGRGGDCLRQVITSKPIEWTGDGDSSTVAGDTHWQNYRVSSDVLLEQPGYVDLIGRMEDTSVGNSYVINGYHLRLSSAGQWSLIRKRGEQDTILASGGHAFSLNTWHTLTLSFVGDRITAAIDGTIVVLGLSDGSYDRGLVGYQVSRYQNAEFQNLAVTPEAAPPPSPPLPAVSQAGMTATATSFQPTCEPGKAIDGDPNTFWHTEFPPDKATLPQAITLSLGQTYTLNSLTYLPRQDGSGNGRITEYNIYTSLDGANFTRMDSGVWVNDATLKHAALPRVRPHYVRLEAVDADGGYASAAEIRVTWTPVRGG